MNLELDKSLVDYIINIVKAADIIGIESVIIEPNMVRSMNDSRTVGLWTDTNVPDMPFGSIGITRLHELKTRLDTVANIDDFSIKVAVNEDEGYAKQFTLHSKSEGIKIEYRCGDPRRITAPRVLNDIDCYSLDLTPNAVSFYQKGLIMGSDEVSIISNEGVKIVFTDISNDKYEKKIADTVGLIQNEDGEVESTTKFAHRYHAKTLLSLFKNNQEATFTICKRGMIKFPINDLTVFVIPNT